ncbi:hypothetical protein IGI04_034267 [Brassica rapa subsp. trilocularis]|uniref:Uncharacterized protein n=1 Tax=Brassica rapa subsp. trilocularis TaxID=1813537 RepID=A0ABQ7L965_BRACM|nr:hypothetical protein IGI04_034267 [Brassica rapa subsp. trilocularis]
MRELDEKPISCRELPKEGRSQTMIAMVPTASNRNPKCTRAKNPNTSLKPAGKVRGEAENRRCRRSAVCTGDYRLHYISSGPYTPI